MGRILLAIGLALLMLNSKANAQGEVLDDSSEIILHQVDSTLNFVYSSVLQDYSDYPLFIRKFKEAQRAWIIYRDAQMEAKFPEPNVMEAYGSSISQCRRFILADLEKKRLDEISIWYNGIEEETDVCHGSVYWSETLDAIRKKNSRKHKK